jgi:hypothetical protein
MRFRVMATNSICGSPSLLIGFIGGELGRFEHPFKLLGQRRSVQLRNCPGAVAGEINQLGEPGFVHFRVEPNNDSRNVRLKDAPASLIDGSHIVFDRAVVGFWHRDESNNCGVPSACVQLCHQRQPLLELQMLSTRTVPVGIFLRQRREADTKGVHISVSRM